MPSHAEQFERLLRITLYILVALLILLSAALLHAYHTVEPTIRTLRTQLHSASPTSPVTNVNFIQPWMTYDYIAHIYDLPSAYLKNTLQIADKRYPRVSIQESAEAQHESVTSLESAVKQAVSDYLAAQNPGT